MPVPAINSVDHLGELIIKMHRNKCTALINHATAPCMFKDLQRNIGDAQCSLVIDDCTNIASVKQLCVVIRFFSATLNKIVSTFFKIE